MGEGDEDVPPATGVSTLTMWSRFDFCASIEEEVVARLRYPGGGGLGPAALAIGNFYGVFE